MAKILIFSDLHAHNFKEFSYILPNGKNSRFQNQLDTLDFIMKTAIDLSVDSAYFLGDLIHSRKYVSVEVLLEIVKKLNGLFTYFDSLSCKGNKQKLFLISGNHDYSDFRCKSSLLNLFELNDMGEGSLCDNLIWSHNLNPGFKSVCIPYIEDRSHALERINAVIPCLSKTQPNILFSHLEAGTVGNIHFPLSLDDIQAKKFTKVFLGHVHKPEYIKEYHTCYVGSCTSIDWNDADQDKGIVLYDTEADEITRIPLPIETYRHKTIKYLETIPNIDHLTEWDFVKIYYKNKTEEQLSQLENLIKQKKCKFVVKEEIKEKQKEIKRLNVSVTSSQNDVITEYVDNVDYDFELDKESLKAIGKELLK